METLRIMIADNQAETRSALRLVIELEPGFTVAGEVDEANVLPEIARAIRPDVILLDWRLCHKGGPSQARNANTCSGVNAKLVRELRLANPNIKILALSGRPESKSDALAAGVDAFICKSESPDRLLEALHSIYKHHRNKCEGRRSDEQV